MDRVIKKLSQRLQNQFLAMLLRRLSEDIQLLVDVRSPGRFAVVFDSSDFADHSRQRRHQSGVGELGHNAYFHHFRLMSHPGQLHEVHRVNWVLLRDSVAT
tara:strand:+ start:724 stop:1026 length:303 start_codon:yes stop_codon:yes gene_type:complete